MTEILTESFCERCGTRYTFESTAPRKSRLSRVRVLSKGMRNFVLSDDASFEEAMADARSEVELAATTHQLDAFHETFNFCLTCRQYTCGDCWNTAEGRCLTCAPIPGRELPEPAAAAILLEPEAAVATNGHVHADEAWPDADLSSARLARALGMDEADAPDAGAIVAGGAIVEAADDEELTEVPQLIGIAPGQSLEDAIAEYEARIADEESSADEAVALAAGAAAAAGAEPDEATITDDGSPAEEPHAAGGIGLAPRSAAVAALGHAAAVHQEPDEPVVDLPAAAAAAALVASVEPVAAAEPAAEPAAVEEPEPVVAAALEPEPALAAEPEPPAAQPEPEPVMAVAPEPEPEPEPVAVEPEPEPVAVAQEPEPIVVEPEPEPVAAAEPPRVDVVPQPTWPAPTAPVEPVAPPASVPAAPAPAPWLTVAPEESATEPQWPVAPQWHATASRREVPNTLAGRLLVPQADPSGLWAASAREVLTGAPAPTPEAAAAAPTAQPCVSCGLSLSANARFCRRCGTRQG